MEQNQYNTWIPFYTEMADKLLAFKNDRKVLVDIVYGLGNSAVGYIHTEDGGHVSDIDPFTVYGIFNRGISNDNRIKLCTYFKQKLGINADVPSDFDGIPVVHNMKAMFFRKGNEHTDVQPLWDLFVASLSKDESNLPKCFDIVCKQQGIKWNITMGLYWIRPYDFISLDSRNRAYLPSLGIDVFKEFQIDASHYFSLLHAVKDKITAKKIEEKSIPEISYQAWIDDAHQTSGRKYWLVGYSFGSNDSQFDRFIKDSIWEGRFNDGQANDQKLLSLAQSIREGDVLILKSSGTKGTKHDQPFLRVKAVGVVIGDIEMEKKKGFTSCTCEVKYYGVTDHDFDIPALGSYRKTIHVADTKAEPVIEYADTLIGEEDMPEQKYKEYIELLKEARNLVLTGAPGTGKTYMAQKIAKEMGAVTKFVQFHPSYDYTDFVEGLRPVEKGNGQMGFERKDGVFKEFCCEAIKNLVDSAKSVESLTKEMSWQEKLEQFVEDAIEKGTPFKTVNGSEFVITDMKNRTIMVHNEHNQKTTEVAINADDILELLTNEVPLKIVRDIRNYFNRKFGTQPDSYAFVITRAVRAMKQKIPVVEVSKVERKPFVFIIDEINRGEASKIFGELFYAIDPGYRGKKDFMVQTQYQNLVPETDVFANGFYVPENVYILATMNDIDRSVENMDFAMRRRFTWKEVTPADTEAMLDSLTCATEAKAVMERLNKAIAETDGLGAAYQIGPSYFLKLGENGGDFDRLWTMNIEPLLKEYLRGFRKASDILEKFNKAYFDDGKNEN